MTKLTNKLYLLDMRKLFSAILIALFGTTAIAQVNDYKLNIGDFNEMTVANSINVIYRCNPDSAGIATYSCQKATASAITFTNDRNKLKVEVISDEPLTELPTITVYSMSLAEATNWGDSTVYVDKIAPTTSFKAKVIGNGKIIVRNLKCTSAEASVKAGSGNVWLSGQALKAKYTIMSAGAIEAGNLPASQVKCIMFGTGSIDCNALESLNVDGMGSGKVYYKGTPTIKKHVAGVKLVQVGSVNPDAAESAEE